MPDRGLDWYKRDPQAFIDSMQGLKPELIGTCAILIDLMYCRAGKIQRDDRHLGGVLGCSTRKAKSLTDKLIEIGKIIEKDGMLTNRRALREAKSKSEWNELRVEAGRKGGIKSGEARRNRVQDQANKSGKCERNGNGDNSDESSGEHAESVSLRHEISSNSFGNYSEISRQQCENNDLNEAPASTREEEKRREDTTTNPRNPDRTLERSSGMGDNNGSSNRRTVQEEKDQRIVAAGLSRASEKDDETMRGWADLGLTIEDTIRVIRRVRETKPDPGPPSSMAYFNNAMNREASKKKLATRSDTKTAPDRIVESIQSGKRFLCTQITAVQARKLIAEGKVTEAQCDAVGVDH